MRIGIQYAKQGAAKHLRDKQKMLGKLFSVSKKKLKAGHNSAQRDWLRNAIKVLRKLPVPDKYTGKQIKKGKFKSEDNARRK